MAARQGKRVVSRAAPTSHDTPGRRARRERNRQAILARELVTLPQTIAILEADMRTALERGNATLAKSKAVAIENCRRRLRVAKERAQ